MVESYSEAALRHSAAADCLAGAGQTDGAGYLIGFAVECAIKHAICFSRSATDVPHIHLPKLVEGAKKALQGRRKHTILSVLQKSDFMHQWDIDVRYAADGTVNEDQFRRWRADANRTLAAANLKR